MNRPLPINKNTPTKQAAPSPVPNSSGGVTDTVRVPADLVAFATTPQFQRVLLNVKEQSQINFISVKRNDDTKEAETILIDAPSADSALIAKKLLELHFKQHLKLQRAESRLEQVQGDLFNAQGELASGMMIEFKVNQDLIGMLIGKSGSRIKQVEEATGIKSVNVDGATGKVTIVGPDSASVQRAREALELFEMSFDVTPAQADYLSDMRNGSLGDIRTTSDVIVCRVDKGKNQVNVVGTGFAVRSARIILNTELEYISKQIELEGAERMARDQLSSFRKQYSIYTPGGEGRGGGGRGGRGDGGYANNNGAQRNNSNNSGGNPSSSSLASLPLPRKAAAAEATPPAAPAQADTKRLLKKEKKVAQDSADGASSAVVESMAKLTVKDGAEMKDPPANPAKKQNNDNKKPAPKPAAAPEAAASSAVAPESAEKDKKPKKPKKANNHPAEAAEAATPAPDAATPAPAPAKAPAPAAEPSAASAAAAATESKPLEKRTRKPRATTPVARPVF